MEKGFSGDIIKELNLKPDKVIDLIKNMKPCLEHCDEPYYNNLAYSYTLSLNEEQRIEEIQTLTNESNIKTINQHAIEYNDNTLTEKSNYVLDAVKREMILENLLLKYAPEVIVEDKELTQKDLEKIIHGIEKAYTLNKNYSKGENDMELEAVNREDMIINKLHLNPEGVLNLVKSMKEVTDVSDNMYLDEVIANQISGIKGKEIDEELNSLKVYTSDLGCMTPDLTMQVLNYQNDTCGHVIIPKTGDELSYMTKDIIVTELLNQYVPDKDIKEEVIDSKDFDVVIEGIAKDFSLQKFQSKNPNEKQGFSYEIEQTFKANINGVTVTDSKVFDATLDILEAIQDVKNIPMNDKEFTGDLVEALQRMSDKNENFNFEEMLEGTYESLTSAPTLKDFKVVDYYGQKPENSYAATLNNKMEFGSFEHLTAKSPKLTTVPEKEKTASR